MRPDVDSATSLVLIGPPDAPFSGRRVAFRVGVYVCLLPQIIVFDPDTGETLADLSVAPPGCRWRGYDHEFMVSAREAGWVLPWLAENGLLASAGERVGGAVYCHAKGRLLNAMLKTNPNAGAADVPVLAQRGPRFCTPGYEALLDD